MPRFSLPRIAEWLGFDEIPDDLDDLRLVTLAEAAEVMGISTSDLLEHLGPLTERARVDVGRERRFIRGRLLG